jgi:heavy metal translocating P-type ATPase
VSRITLPVSIAGLAGGLLLRATGASALADVALVAAIVVVLVPLAVEVTRALRRRETGVDLIALLAMLGALLLGEYLAGAVIALMLSGGQELERRAGARATRELTALLARAPRVAHRRQDGELVTVPVDEVVAGDELVVKAGEVVPVDGMVAGSRAVLDEAALTGESRPVERADGDRIRSGAVNAGGPFTLRAVTTAADSTYAGIVRLVSQAQASKAPFVRLADRYALLLLPVTLVVAGGAWLLSGDPVRALAVLVVATPCPLILAAPIAITSGVSRSARRGIIVKGGGALETLARVRTVLLDKTGTLTAGFPRLVETQTFTDLDPDEVLRLAASLDQVSSHVFSAAIVRAARERGLPLPFPTDVEAQPGEGIRGVLEGRHVAVGKAAWAGGDRPLPSGVRTIRRRTALEGNSAVFVGVDGGLAGALLLDDPLRPESPRAVRALRASGVSRVVLLTGDQPDVAELVGAAVGADLVLAERSPADKVAAVREASSAGVTAMVGDGVNDAPALAVADVGVAMGARGATASSEAADVVLTVDRLDRLAEAIDVARRSRGIALQSVVAGMAMSFVAMGFAAVGLLAPVAGALVQEAIDLAVIANALRALRTRVPADLAHTPLAEASGRFRAEHDRLLPKIDRLRALADRIDRLPRETVRAELTDIQRFLADDLAAHQQAEEAVVYPLLARQGGTDAVAPLATTSREATRLIRLLFRLVRAIPEDGPDSEDQRELRRLLYGLHAILRLHFAQKEELYLDLGADVVSTPAPEAAAERS